MIVWWLACQLEPHLIASEEHCLWFSTLEPAVVTQKPHRTFCALNTLASRGNLPFCRRLSRVTGRLTYRAKRLVQISLVVWLRPIFYELPGRVSVHGGQQ